jgi:hypothetical protein
MQAASDLNEIASQIMDGIRRCRREARRMLSEEHSAEPQVVGTLDALLYFCGERIDSMLVLADYGRLWDVEILERSLQEATIKMLFICLTDSVERQRRIKEYSQDLYEIDLLKRSNRARDMLSIVDHDEVLRSPLEPLILDSSEEKRLTEKWPQRRRKALEQKWSFSEMLKDLDSFFAQRADAPFMKVALHNYGISSHLIHADDTALGLVMDRLSREPREQEAMVVAHLLRMLGDTFWFTAMSCIAVKHALGVKSDVVPSTVDELAPVFDRMRQLPSNTG